MNIKSISCISVACYVVGMSALLVIVLIPASLLSMSPRPVSHAAGAVNWTTYMGSNAHTGFNSAETILNVTTARHLKLHWKYQAGGPVSSQPMIVNGVIYWGSWDGYEHATNLNGQQIWQTYLGKIVPPGCFPPLAGVASPATVTTIPINGVMTNVVLVGGGDAHLYALNAANGSVIWSVQLGTSPDYMVWGGASIYNGNVYIGRSSYGDCPLVPGEFFELNASTGAIEHSYTVVPSGCVGAGIWMTPTIDEAANTVYVTTGTIHACTPYENLAYAVLEFSTTDLTLLHSWQVPPAQESGDGDFGSTPTLFTAMINGVVHQMIGTVNKNGIYYAFDRANISAGPLWQVRLSSPAPNDKSSISSTAWDGRTLYAGNSHTTVGTRNCQGSVRALNPATGAFLWERCMPGKILGSMMAVPGMLAVGSGNFLIVLDAATGQQVFAFYDPTKSSLFWGTPTICNGMLYIGNRDGAFYAFGL